MFRRTAAGLANEHLFYDVEFIAYCEGEVKNDATSTFDELYWSTLLRTFSLRVKVKSVGSKRNVLALLDDIRRHLIKNVLLCVDRDYDDFLGSAISHPALLYTNGYSWESDAVHMCNFSSLLNLFANFSDPTEQIEQLNLYLVSMERRVKRICLIDIRYIDAPTALFDRHRPQSILKNSMNCAPAFNVQIILESAAKIAHHPQRHISCASINAWKDFFGKSVVKIFYQWFCYSVRESSSSRKIQYETFLAVLASNFDTNDNDIYPYYRNNVDEFVQYCAT